MSDAAARLSASLADRYRIERELGQGGMATVYLAADLKHDRKVAIKVLKPDLAAVLGAERFIAEIKTTAALSHPHILPLFDSGSAGQGGSGSEFLYYVMPYIEGETIREKLTRETQFGIDEAVRITTEVADALDYAHRHGVIHRDIKPENILLHDGRAMVMDFGIALAVSAAAGGRMTETGLSLGTPHYMSPEQATADKAITARSDVYSLASVLFEMLTGEPPHMGNSAQAIIMKIVTDVPRSVLELRKSVPPNVAAAVGKALEKLPADRFESAKAFAEALGNAAFAHQAAGTAPSARVVGAGNRRLVAARTAGMAVLAAALGWVLRGARVPEEPAVSLHAFLSDTALVLMTGGSGVAISPDGKTVIVSRSPFMPDGSLFVRAMDDNRFRRIDGTAGMASPRISPDGQFVVFEGGSRGIPAVRRMPLGGGPVTTLADSASLAGWCDDGSLIVQRRGTTMRIAEAGAAPVPIMELDSIEVGSPSVLPDCSGLLFNDARNADGRGLLLDLRTGAVSVIATPANRPRYVASGHILFLSERSPSALMALPFDLDRHRVTGSPVQMVPRIWHWDLSRTATLVYAVPPSTSTEESLAWVDLSGRATTLPITGPGFENPRISPSGRHIAYEDDEARALVSYDISTGETSKLVEERRGLSSWAWAPDGRAMYVVSGRQILRVSTSGTGTVDTLYEAGDQVRLFAVSPDQDWLVLAERVRVEERGWDITLLQLGGPTPSIEPYLRANWNEVQPALSPDGRWLAYVSDESGSHEVYVRSFPVPGDPVQVSENRGTAPVWAGNGTTIFYDGATDLMRAELTIAPAGPVVRSRTRLFAHDGFEVSVRGMFTAQNLVRRWDIAPEGTRLLMVRSAEESFSGESSLGMMGLGVITNFPDAIRRRMAAP